MAEDFDFLSQMESIGRPSVVKKPWMDTKKFVLVTNEMLPSVVDECIKSGLYALDLETTGLDSRVFDGRTVDSISGACLSPDGEVGYYIPVQHPGHEEVCVSYSLFKSELRRLADSPAVAIFHNGKFDQDFLQFCGSEPIGEWDDPKKWEDTLILAYLRNTRAKEKGLKFLSKTELGMEMIELDELFTDEQIEESGKDFGKLDPRWEPVLLYAASDAICTYLLFKKIRDEAVAAKAGLPSQEAIYFLEKQCVAATRWMERNRVPVNREGIAKLIKMGLDEWLPALTDVYEASSKIFGRDVSPGYFKILTDPKSPLRFSVDDPSKTIMDYVDAARIEAARRQMDPIEPSTGKIKTIDKVVQTLKVLGSEAKWDPKKTETVSFPVVYDILVEEQIGNLFREMGIPGLLATPKSGQVKTSMDVIEGILEEYGEDYPYLKKIKRFRNVRKAISTYLMPIYEFTDPKYSPDGRMRINFEAFKIDTARFCTPAGKSSGKFSGRVPLNFHSLPSGKGKDVPMCLKGVRTTVEAEEGYMIVAVDFSAEELRIVTNLSGEPMWEREFFRCGSCKHEFDRSVETLPPPPDPPPPFCPKCGSDNIGDLHTLTAIALYGEEIVNDPQFKTYRGYAKGTNFALCYGGGGQAVVRAAGTTLEEGWRIVRKFTGAYKGLARWWATQVDFAKKHGCVLTAFNRRYPLPDIHHENGFFQKKAERNAVNGPIQGCIGPESTVVTNRGIFTIEELWNQLGDQGRFVIWTGQSWEEARPLLSGMKPLALTRLEDGVELNTSPDHRFRAWRNGECDWVHQQDLQVGDWILQDACHAVEYPLPRYVFSDKKGHHNNNGFVIDGNHSVLWELLGRIVGDGSFTKDGFIVFIGEVPACLSAEADVLGYSAKQHAEEFAQKVRDALGIIVKVKEAKQANRSCIWKVVIYNRAFLKFCTDVLGFCKGNTYTKEFPKAVWKESVENRAAFLRGYFDADGAVDKEYHIPSVRSVNQKLLRETYLLLRSIGIRASWRRKSHYVTVLDRQTFKDVVGFTVPHKAARLAQSNANPYTYKNTKLPPDIVSAVGQALRDSPDYTSLPRGMKSAVLRLCAGSGSKSQCLSMIDLCKHVVVDDRVKKALSYDYSRVTSKEDTGKTITMYDVEVFDKEHAFACDGVIVHNSGSDLIKYAMGMIYKECKKRGWLNKVRMILTMHDELVFEIHKSVMEPALDMIKEVMVKKTISRLRWKVPLTCDIECGSNYSVPMNVTRMWYGVDPIPDDLKDVFHIRYTKTGDVLPPSVSVTTNTVETQQIEQIHHPEPPSPEENPRVQLKKGETHIYTIPNNKLTMTVLYRVGQIVAKCRGRGTHPLIIKTDAGYVIMDDSNVMVNPLEFDAAMSLNI